MAVGAGATAIPHWLAHAFGLGHGGGDEAPEIVDPACLVDGDGRRLLLVLIVPVDDGTKRPRGEALGAWLNHGTDAQIAPLAAIDLLCAPASEIESLGGEPVEGEPWAVLIDRRDGHTVPIDLDLPSHGELMKNADDVDSPDEWRKLDLRASLDRIELLATALMDPVREGLKRSAEDDRARLGAGKLEALRAAVTDRGAVPAHVLDEGAGVLLVEAADPTSGLEQARVDSLLADVARRRFVVRRVPGSRWANSRGCGVQVEGEEPVFIGCGMGNVPQLSQRFLYWFTEDR